jgi:RNA polymerase sigma factor (sigma-70 family)
VRVKKKGPATEAEAVDRYFPFIFRTAKRYANRGVPFDDLLQVGRIAVALAFRTWRPDGGRNFLTWIRHPVSNAMFKALANERSRDGRAGVDRRTAAARYSFSSMDELLPGHAATGVADFKTLHDIVGTFDEPVDFLALKRLPKAMQCLSPKERSVIRQRFVLDRTLDEIAKPMGLSRERIRQIERDALSKLRKLIGHVATELYS